MTVKVTMEDSLIQPLIEEHLANGTSVGKQIADAVSFYLKCISEIKNERTVISCKLQRGYANEQKILLPKTSTDISNTVNEDTSF